MRALPAARTMAMVHHVLRQHADLSWLRLPFYAGAAAALHAPRSRWPRHLHAVHAVGALAAQRECNAQPCCKMRLAALLALWVLQC